MTRYLRRLALPLLALALTAVGPASSRGQQTVEPPLAPPRPGEQLRAAADDPRAELTETVGLLSGLYLYQTYLNIGLLADGKADGIYEEKAARAVLATVVTPLDAVDRQLARVHDLAQTETDRRAGDRVRAIAGLLRREGRELVVFWDNRRPEDGARYEATRQEVWGQLNALLGLDRK